MSISSSAMNDSADNILLLQEGDNAVYEEGFDNNFGSDEEDSDDEKDDKDDKDEKEQNESTSDNVRASSSSSSASATMGSALSSVSISASSNSVSVSTSDQEIGNIDADIDTNIDTVDIFALARKVPISHQVSLAGHAKAVMCISVEPAGNRVVTGSLDYGAKLFDFGGMDRLAIRIRWR
jgi:hypothetical protein